MRHGSTFVSEPADTPANQFYDDIVLSIPEYRSSMASSMPAGVVLISNEAAARDSWFDDAWDGRDITIYLGDPSWPKSDFRISLTGIIDDIDAPRISEIQFHIRDKKKLLDAPTQTTLLTTGPRKGQPSPLCYGTVFNICLIQIDPVAHIYKVHDGPISAVNAVRDDGAALGAPGGYTADLPNGTITLSSSPVGRLTADVDGANPGGSFLVNAAEIIEDLVTREVLTSGDLDSASFSDFETTAPQTLGLFIEDQQTLVRTVDSILESVGGWWSFNRDGKIILGQLDEASGVEDLTLDADDILQSGLTMTDRQNVVKTVRVGYARNWAVQTDNLAHSISETLKGILGQEYSVVSSTDGSVSTAHPAATEPDMKGTFIVSESDAQDESDRLLALHDTPRHTYSINAMLGPSQVEIGDIIELTHPRFGFDSGVDAVVVSISEQSTLNQITLGLWV